MGSIRPTERNEVIVGYSHPLPLKKITISDEFWNEKQELVRTQMIPYQWNALNDNVEGADPSFCMHNFRAAARQNAQAEKEKTFKPPKYTFRGFETLPDDPEHPDPDAFYGYVFQDSDFSKWIETVGYSLANHPDPRLEAIADSAIDIVCAAQLDNGYLDTYYILNGMDRAFTNLKDHHELYCFGHLVEGAVAYWQGTGKDKLLKAACRFADYIVSRFGLGEGKIPGYPGHEVAEMALVRLYDATGHSRYLDLSRYFIDQRGTEPLYFDVERKEAAKRDGKEDSYRRDIDPDRYMYNQSHLPVRYQKEAVGHAVRAVYLYSGMADIARETGDDSLFDACVALWRSIVDSKLYITGGVGSTNIGEAFSYPFDLPNDMAYSETCASVGLVFFARRMLQLDPHAEYADVLERTLYNAALAGVALDGKSFFYVNPLEVEPYACKHDKRKSFVKSRRQSWFGCACCPTNIARLIESVQEYAVTQTDDTLWFHLYIGGEYSVSFGGSELDLTVKAAMPWSGKGSIAVAPHDVDSVTATLAFRLPGWAGGEAAERFVTVRERDERKTERTVHNGYVYLRRQWRAGDSIEFDFPMTVSMKSASTSVRADINKVAFSRGPIVFCAEEDDNGSDMQLLSVDVEAAGSHCGNVTAETWDELGEKMVRLRVPGLREEKTSRGLYADYQSPCVRGQELTFIPYYAWANRTEGEMSVWLRATENIDRSKVL
jgi:DUF1680 family protein